MQQQLLWSETPNWVPHSFLCSPGKEIHIWSVTSALIATKRPSWRETLASGPGKEVQFSLRYQEEEALGGNKCFWMVGQPAGDQREITHLFTACTRNSVSSSQRNNRINLAFFLLQRTTGKWDPVHSRWCLPGIEQIGGIVSKNFSTRRRAVTIVSRKAVPSARQPVTALCKPCRPLTLTAKNLRMGLFVLANC